MAVNSLKQRTSHLLIPCRAPYLRGKGYVDLSLFRFQPAMRSARDVLIRDPFVAESMKLPVPRRRARLAAAARLWPGR